ncbi:glycoside hydrolase family 3 C-terminal domain-containing protein [Salinimicrobium sp. MT39]|uniref:Glycoside hydrolase family 3 C-terminal domain-containing protein n=1 Tax=Salinimicrobium profundisediminis TaxID=2994553 RepID=A0A9X3I101_9FLAO|nr:glycoside hydrolase family 3 C-terminal domain-containing protein [Salinimicrobium profundisediminis]MCX2837953.1 glycoside hydrolase family 3 C-terminal domain-containing protein [Salinimicrobium profundisediminis]
MKSLIIRKFLILLITFITGFAVAQENPKNQNYPFNDPTLSIEERTQDLINRLTIEEKAWQMMHNSPAVERLGIPEYNWWNEALHGIGRSGVATVFPQAIGMGATFDEDLILEVANAISDEARATHNTAVENGYRRQYSGLTFWTPNINIFRDPRWGRGQETYGEDPFLTALLGTAFVKGLQGDHPKYLKTAAAAKHYAVHSGPEKLRHEFNAEASMKDMWETYLPAFKALVDADVETIMCAYNATNGEPCCANKYLLQDVLRDKWNFQGHIVSDCWALVDFYEGHNVVETPEEAAALGIKSGVNLNCGSVYPSLVEAVEQGLVTEVEIDEQLAVLLKTKFKLGLFDPAEDNPYSQLSAEDLDTEEHRALARKVAQKSIVMLKNNGALPLKNDLSKYFITGPNATSIEVLLGNYHGINPNLVTILEGLAGAIEPQSQMQYRQGTLLDRPNANPQDWASPNAGNSDATIAVLGISGVLEGEEGESIASETFGDRLDYNLPQNQIDYLRKLNEAAGDAPVIAVITGGSPMNLQEVHELADAVLLVWYPGEEGGNAVADVIFGKVSPSGRLPITFPKSLDDLPAYEDYSMEGRTYKYMDAEPMYPFGYGLSYSDFNYSEIKLSDKKLKKGKSLTAKVVVTNSGETKAEEVVQLYVSDLKASVRTPKSQLYGIKRVELEPGASEEISFEITPQMMQLVNNEGESVLESGEFSVYIGGSSPGKRSIELGKELKEANFTLR